MSFKKVLLLVGVIGLSGCAKAPKEYIDAAKLFAEDLCEGKVLYSDDRDTLYFNGLNSKRRVTNEGFVFRYTCVSEKGSQRQWFNFKDIPVKYFTLDNNQPLQ